MKKTHFLPSYLLFSTIGSAISMNAGGEPGDGPDAGGDDEGDGDGDESGEGDDE